MWDDLISTSVRRSHTNGTNSSLLQIQNKHTANRKQFRSLVKRVPICLIARKQQPGFECDLWPFALSSLALLSCLLCNDEFWIRVKKIEERNAANHNPSRPDRWPCRYQSHLCFLVAQGQSGLALLWNLSNHKQFNYQINWATWLNQLCARVCRPGYLTHIHSKVRLTGVPELDMVTIHCHGSQFRNKYIFKKETFLFLSAQWAAVSTLT